MDIKQQLDQLIHPGPDTAFTVPMVQQIALAALTELERLEGPFAVMNSRAHVPGHMVIPMISVTNLARCLRWHPGGLDSWSLSDWAVALAGEVGELCNVIKKLNRVRDGLPGNKETDEELRAALGPEIADVYLYLDLLAQCAGVTLETAIRDKFNAVSERLEFPERL